MSTRQPHLMERLSSAARAIEPLSVRGRIREITGIVVHAAVPLAHIGELCQLRDPISGRQVPAEVIGLRDEEAILTPIGDLDGMSNRAEVIPMGYALQMPVGPGLLGCVLNPLGQILSKDKTLREGDITAYYPCHASPPEPLDRDFVNVPLQLGISAIDGLLTIARGQRVGIFGEPGVGKSTLLSSIVGGTQADIVVIALIGERGREVRDFVDIQLTAEARARSVVVVATSDRPAIERVKAAHGATAIAEYFRDQGKHVLLLMDSVTRFARAQREIGLAAGEPPTRRGFPPSLFAALPRLLERAGPGRGGSITALYTVLTEGDDALDPVAEETKAILDGHIRLSADLAQKNHFPAIDILRSRSRLMDSIVTKDHLYSASRVRDLLARYEEVELLVRVGEYKQGNDPRSDEAIAKHEKIQAFLKQVGGRTASFEDTVRNLKELAS